MPDKYLDKDGLAYFKERLNNENEGKYLTRDQAGSLTDSRVEQLEIEVSNIRVSQQKTDEDGAVLDDLIGPVNLAVYENFDPPTEIDETSVPVIAISGDIITVESVNGINEGMWYWISDGINQEQIQIQGIISDGSNVAIKATLQNTYVVANTNLYRTVAGVGSGVAIGSNDKRNIVWKPEIDWSGRVEQQTTTQWLSSTLSDEENFTLSGNAGFNLAGEITLV